MAAFALPAGHPFTAVRPGYAGYETTPGVSILNVTASYIGAAVDYPNNTVTLQLFATFGGTWTIATPPGLTLQTAPVNGQAYTSATYTGGIKSSTYTFTSITLTPVQGSAVAWTGIAPSVTLLVPNIATSILPSGSYYIGGNAIYLEPVPVDFGVQTILGLTDYVFACTTSAAYLTVDSLGTGIIPFPPGSTFAPGTTTALDFTVACRSNGIIGVPSEPYTINIVSPAVPTLTAQSIIGTTINFLFSVTTPGCTFNLRYGSAFIGTNITSPFGYNMQVPGIYTFSIQAVLSNLSAFSAPYTATIQPAQPTNVVATLVGATTVSLAWTSLGVGYTYNVSEIRIPTQNVQVSTALFTGLSVGPKTFYVQSLYAGVTSTTCNIQFQLNTQPPTNFTATVFGATITLNWLASPTPGTTYNITSAGAGNVTGITGTTYFYTSLASGPYSFAIVGVSGTIETSPLTVNATVVLTIPTNFVATTIGTTANLTWQDTGLGNTFAIAWSGPQSGTATSSIKSATITGLGTPGVYTFSVRSVAPGAGSSSAAVTTTATIVTAPTSFTALANGTVIRLGWLQSTPNCSFLISSALGNTTTTNTSFTYPTAPVGSYTFSLTPTVTGTSFVGPTVTTGNARVFNGPSPVIATLSGPNVNVAWTAIAGCTYTVSSSPGITDPPPAPPGTLTSVQFVVPNPQTYTFTVLASDASGNISIPATSSPLLVPLPAPINVGSTMTTSSVVVVTWTEQQDQCSFIINGVPSGITPEISLLSFTTGGGLPAYNYQGILRGVPTTTGLVLSVVASLGGVNSVASQSVTQYTFSTFEVSLSARCSQSGTTNNVTAAYTMTSPAAIYGPGTNGQSPYTANMVYSQAGTLTPAATSGPSGTYRAGFYGMATGITNTVPTTFGLFVVPPTNIAVTANGTTLLVRWNDSTTAGCRYTVVGTPGTFTSNVAAGGGSTGITFLNAAIGTAYTFTITASSTGSYTASRFYGSVTTETATVPYTITSVSVPSAPVTPINFPTPFTATATGPTVTMNWGAVTGATGYNVLNGGSTLITTTATTYSFTGTVGTAYSLAVQAVAGGTSSNTTATIPVTPIAAPTFSSFSQTGSTLVVGVTGTNLSINTPTGLTLASTTANSFTFSGVGGNTAYSFTLTSTGTNATSSATSSFTTMGTPVITSATAQGTATITVNWTYAGPTTVTGFSVYVNNVLAASVGPSVFTAVFAQPAGINNTDTVYVVATIGAATSIPSASVNVADLAIAPTLASSTVNALGFTVQWTYPTTARALSNFQVCNSALTTLYSTVPYVANQLNYNALFNVPSIAPYSFVIVGRDSFGSTVVSAASTSVTPVAAPTITSFVQTGATITIAATGTGLSTPTVSPALSTVSTSSPWVFSGVTANTLYTFTVQANGPGASNTSSSTITTTMSTPGIPTVSASGTTITVDMPPYSSSASFSLFVNPYPGNWTKTSASASLGWISIASSSDGTKLAAVAFQGGIYTNANSGAGLWITTSAASLGWTSIASSSDGTKLAAVASQGGIWTNASSGVGSWTQTSASASLNWRSIASSSDGTKLAAITEFDAGRIYTNANSGAGDWIPTSAPLNDWISIASSSDGTKLAAAIFGGGIWTNASSGAGLWTQTSASSFLWSSIASSSDGTKLAAVVRLGGVNKGIYTNSNSGAGNWIKTSASASLEWFSIASSSDGTKLAATTYGGGGIYTNSNSGAGDWIPTSASASLNWRTIASSSDGTKLAAAAPPGGIWTIDLSAPINVQGTSTTFTGLVGITYSVSVTATIGGNSSIASPSPLTSPLSAAPGCILWLDGADPNNTGSPVVNGTTITTWKDKSGNANDATSASGTITVTANNLVFDGSSKYLTVPGIAGKIVNTPFVIFVVETFAGARTFPRSPASLSTALSGSLPVVGNFGDIYTAVGSDNSFYMGVFSESKLYKISSAPNYTITDITTGSGINIPTALLRALDGNIFIVSGGNGSIQKYNITEGVTTVFAATGTTYQCYGMTEAPDGTVYVSNRSSFSIQVIPSTGWSGGLAPILVSFTAQLGGIIYANDGFLYVSMAGGNLYRVNPTTGANTLLMNTGGVGLSTFSQGPDGFIYGNSGRNMYTLSITYQTYLVTRLLTTATAFTQCFGPDGTLYISDRTGKLYRVLSYNPPYTDGSPISFYFGDDNVNNAGAAGHTLHTGYRSINSQTFALYGSDLEDYSIIPQPGETRIWGMYLPNTANRNTRRNGNVDVTFTNNSRLQAFTAPRIGRVFGTYYFRGTIAEILIFPSDIGIPAIQRVEQYLANKWKVSSKSGIITPIATPTVVSAAANGGTITVTCGTPTTGIVLNIPTTPTGLTLSGSTTTTFTYTGAAAATTYPFLVYGYNGPAISSAASTSVTTLYTPGTPTVSAAGTTVNIAWTYGASPTGITFNVRDANNNWAGTSVTGSLTTSFTGEGGKSYSIVVFATSGLNRSLNSGATSTTLIVLGPVTFTQNYQSTTQTRIVGTAASTGAASYSGTRDSTLALSAATVTGQTLTWTGATGGTRYNGVTIGAAAGAATTSIANQSLYSAFDPKTISSCVLWLDAADSTTVTTATASTTVTGWADKSGQGYNMIAGTGTTTYTTYGPGPSIKLNTSYLYVNKAVNLTQFTVFSVLLSQTAVHNQPTVTGRPNTAQSYGTNDGFGLYVDSDFPRLRFYTGTLIVGSTSSSSGNSQGLILSTYTATSAGALSSWFNGAAKSTGTSGARTGTGQGFSIGGEWNGSAYVSQSGTGCVANVYEVIVYNRVLTTIQRQLVERYLAWKWGLQNQLDPGFPLNNFPGTLPLPNTFPGLSLWLDAADTTTITKNGANLSTIKDKSGTNNSWTAGGSTATTFGTIGGVQCITFTGFSQSFITGTYTLTQGQNLTIFMAFNNLEGSQVSLFNNGPSIIFNEGGQLQLVNQTNYTLNYTSAANIPVAANKTYVVAITSSITNSTTASSFAVVNGTIYTMNAGGYSYVTSGSSTFTASTFAYNPWSLGELVVYSGVLTNAQIQQVAGYLIYKWKAY